MNAMLAQALAVAVGGAFGALLRHGINLVCVRGGLGGLPIATLTVNVLGCCLAGLLLHWIDQRADAVFWRALLITGLLGGLTTFSALGLELWQLLRAERWDLIAVSVTAHLVLGVAAVALGWRLGQALFGVRG